jgi:hypothetical protein
MEEDTGSNKRFSFVLTTELGDVLSAQTARQKLRPFYRFRKILMVILVAAIVIELIQFALLFIISVLLRQVSGNPGVNELIKISAIIIAVLIIVLVISILDLDQSVYRWNIKRAFRKNRAENEQYEIIVDSQAVQMNLKDWKTRVGWSRIQKIYAYREGFMLFTDNQNNIIIPNRVIEKQVEIEAFKDFLAQASGKPVVEIE